MLVSVIIPVFNEEENLPLLYQKLSQIFSGNDEVDYEVVFIDDCSTDNSFSILKDLAGQSPNIPLRIVRLACNTGVHIALLIGYRYCRGDAAVVMPADMQCPVEAIPAMIAKYREGFPIVWAVRDERKDPLLTKIFSQLYYLLLRIMVKYKMHFFNIETFLIDRKVIDKIKSTREKNTNIYVLISTLGFRQGSIGVKRGARFAGRSGWSMGRKVKLMLDTLISFSYRPIRFISYLGIFISLGGFGIAANEIYEKLSGVNKPLGWTMLVVLILILSGVQMLMLGVMGEYLWRIFDQISSRPLFVIDTLVNFEDSEEKKHSFSE